MTSLLLQGNFAGMMKFYVPLILSAVLFSAAFPAVAQNDPFRERLREWRETREHRAEGKRRMDADAMGTAKDSYGGREILLHIAPNAPPSGRRALVIILHGGMGNASHIYSVIGQQMNDAADEGGYIIAYLNGSAATAGPGDKFHAWNAGGGCCGQPYKSHVDDIGYITGALDYLVGKYGIDKTRVFALGHSNGAMMAQRLMCESDLLQAAIPISGPLNTNDERCPSAAGKRIWAIHGDADENVPINGGYGTKGVTNIDFQSQASSETVFTKSGADYEIDILPGIDHNLSNIAAAIEKRDQRTLGRDAALFFGLAPK